MSVEFTAADSRARGFMQTQSNMQPRQISACKSGAGLHRNVSGSRLQPSTQPTSGRSQSEKVPASTQVVRYFSTSRAFRMPHMNWGRDKIFEVQREADAFHSQDEASIPNMPPQAKTFRSKAHERNDDFWNDVLEHVDQLGRRLKGPYRIVDKRSWQILASSAIFLNVFLLNLDLSGGRYIEQAILIFSVIEFYMMVVRFRAGYGVWHEGREARMFVCAEAVGLACNVADRWVFPLLSRVEALQDVCWHLSPFMRLLWLLRMTRLIGLLPELHEIYHGVIDALQGMFWVLIFMVLLLYTTAILCTRLVGQAEVREEAREIQQHFKDVGTSMMTLFNIMTAWSLDPLLPFFDANPSATPWFVLFYIFEGWVLLAVTTGVVSFRMIQSKAKLDKCEAEWEIHERRDQLGQTLHNLFVALDRDKNKVISRSEFREVFHSRKVMRMLEVATSAKGNDLLDLSKWLFEFLDTDKSGVVSMSEFEAGFKWLTLPFDSKTLLQIRESLSKTFQDCAERLMGTVDTSLTDVRAQLESPLRKIHAANEQANMLAEAARDLSVHLLPRLPRASGPLLTERDLVHMEKRLTHQLDSLAARLKRIEVVGPSSPSNSG